MTGFARDAQGNYYHTWRDYNCIYKIDRQNAITTYGMCSMNYGGGFSGDVGSGPGTGVTSGLTRAGRGLVSGAGASGRGCTAATLEVD